MSGSEGASASRKSPPLPPGSEPTIAFERSPPAANKPKVDSLLPPGAEEGPPPPMNQAVASSPPPFTLPAQVTSAEIKLAPVVVAAKEQATSLERAERRFWRNAIVFGVSIVVLLVLFYWLAR